MQVIGKYVLKANKYQKRFEMTKAQAEQYAERELLGS